MNDALSIASKTVNLDKGSVLNNLEDAVSGTAFNRSVTTVAQDLFTQICDLQFMTQSVTFGNPGYDSKMLSKKLHTLVVNSVPVGLENSTDPASQLKKELSQKLSGNASLLRESVTNSLLGSYPEALQQKILKRTQEAALESVKTLNQSFMVDLRKSDISAIQVKSTDDPKKLSLVTMFDIPVLVFMTEGNHDFAGYNIRCESSLTLLRTGSRFNSFTQKTCQNTFVVEHSPKAEEQERNCSFKQMSHLASWVKLEDITKMAHSETRQDA